MQTVEPYLFIFFSSTKMIAIYCDIPYRFTYEGNNGHQWKSCSSTLTD